ncbi:MAG: hypothetical protein EBY26_04455 [Microbacteriaceae bacterium]|nr:hypothetical protein [Microbacteriaceae bacterium]
MLVHPTRMLLKCGSFYFTLATSLSVRSLNLVLDSDMFVWAGANSWKKLAKPLTELAQTGRVQMANHTMNHVSLTSVSDRKVKQELVLAGRFIEDTWALLAPALWQHQLSGDQNRRRCRARQARALVWQHGL